MAELLSFQNPEKTSKPEYIGRNDAIKAIKAAFKARGLRYSVTGGRGTGWGWIHIDLLPSVKKGMLDYQREIAYRQLGVDLGLDRVCYSGEGVPANSDYYNEYIDRARGITPRVTGTPYWD